MIVYVVSLVLITGVFVMREWIMYEEKRSWDKERQQLIDRIQSKDIQEYKQIQRIDKPKQVKEEKKEVHRFI
jgi:hypothetical protein